jgi:UDP:flavonoid glycosyltransferase YjiC (YdhE family)
LEQNVQKVLICPLDWGLGHTTRIIPIVRCYLENGYQVILGGSGTSGELLRNSFPALTFVSIPSPVIRYTAIRRYLPLMLLLQIPAMVFYAIKENRLLKRIVNELAINIVVSDNRYGLFCQQAHCIFITHQVSPVLPGFLRWAEYPVYRFIRILIQQYDECWIPDFPDPDNNLSGILSHRFRLPRNARFIGPLSRFIPSTVPRSKEPLCAYELLIILSGPEPQLSILFKKLLKLVCKTTYRTLIITGYNLDYLTVDISDYPSLTIMPDLDPRILGIILEQAKRIICRSGYSGIMDLIYLNKTALLVPTPGQSEQEYLARYLTGKGYFLSIRQHELDDGILHKYMQGEYPSENFATLPDKGELPVMPVSDKENCEHDRKSYEKAGIDLP